MENESIFTISIRKSSGFVSDWFQNLLSHKCCYNKRSCVYKLCVEGDVHGSLLWGIVSDKYALKANVFLDSATAANISCLGGLLFGIPRSFRIIKPVYQLY